MRKLLYILLATVALIAIRGYSMTDSTSATLSFFVVSEGKIDGGRLIDTLDLPKLGYIAAKPELVITQLVAVSLTMVGGGGIYDKDHKLIEKLPDRPQFLITLRPEDAQKFETLTEHSIGRRVLMMLGDVPLTAPMVQAPISSQSIQMTIEKHNDPKKIEDGLRKLVH